MNVKGTRISQYLTVVATGLGASLLVVGLVSAATTISTSITTAGGYTQSGSSANTFTGDTTLANASTTNLSVLTKASFGSTATSSFSSAGALTLVGGLTGTTGSFSSTLGVTGLSTFGSASTTAVSCLGSCTFGSTATSTIDSAGNASIAGTLGVTGATTLASTTATGFKVGQVGTRMTRVVSGYCVTDSLAINASTTTMFTCTPSGGTSVIASADRVLVMATSSLPGRVYVQAASSTAAGTIQVNVFNTGIDAGQVGAAVYALNFWAFQ